VYTNAIPAKGDMVLTNHAQRTILLQHIRAVREYYTAAPAMLSSVGLTLDANILALLEWNPCHHHHLREVILRASSERFTTALHGANFPMMMMKALEQLETGLVLADQHLLLLSEERWL